ncbi:hypothetical protein MmTuc01_2566 [Methanosarcina mazei Tuc01]|uniref:Uncharacterized protein n=1 Tax=Methanosarcina mazei Tuc01 TaxID=1236903 RepID=M1QCA0_METMZ|nr:hypothetical protein MmTuc01_2566 [Methanosarcina mazei Tuc01]
MDFLTLRESQRKVNPGFSYILISRKRRKQHFKKEIGC